MKKGAQLYKKDYLCAAKKREFILDWGNFMEVHRKKTKKGHYAVFGPTLDGRYITIIFELKPKGTARPITGWDMSRAELRYYKKQRK